MYRDQILKFHIPVFPTPTGDVMSTYVYSLTRILVMLDFSKMTISFLTSLVTKQKLLVYQFALNLVESGDQDFLVAIKRDLPQGDTVRSFSKTC